MGPEKSEKVEVKAEVGGHSQVCWECFPEVSDRGWDSPSSSNQKKNHPKAHRLVPGHSFLAVGASQSCHIRSVPGIQEHRSLPARACITCNSFSLDGNTLLYFGDSQERATAPHTQQNELLVLENRSTEQQAAVKGQGVGNSLPRSDQGLSFNSCPGAASAS